MKALKGKDPNHIASLDGLRAIAFLMVLIHHLPANGQMEFFRTVGTYGWAGVELFFVISTYLFFSRLPKEWDLTGTISMSNFYVRRVLRISPLLIAFVIGSTLLFGTEDPTTSYRAAGLIIFIDNFVTAITGSFSSAVPYTSQLWTLSLEFQVYLLIPGAFLLYKSIGARKFGWVLLAIAAYCATTRYLFIHLGIAHPVVWVLPFFRPESILAGIALATYRPQWHWAISMSIAAVAAYTFFSMPSPFGSDKFATMVVYPLGAIMFAALVDAGLRSPFARVLSFRPWAYLGRISYGLYVFHLVGLFKAKDFLEAQGYAIDLTTGPYVYAIYLAMTLAITVMMASISFHFLEKPIEDSFKHKFSALAPRPLAIAPSTVENMPAVSEIAVNEERRVAAE